MSIYIAVRLRSCYTQYRIHWLSQSLAQHAPYFIIFLKKCLSLSAQIQNCLTEHVWENSIYFTVCMFGLTVVRCVEQTEVIWR